MSRPLMSKYETCHCQLSRHRRFSSDFIFERGCCTKISGSYKMYRLMFLLDRSWLSSAPVEVERYLPLLFRLLMKTSLLNLMAHRMAQGRLKMKGNVEYNGGPLKDIKHSYVIQQDILLRAGSPMYRLMVAALTVRETLQYDERWDSADLDILLLFSYQRQTGNSAPS